MKNKPIRRYPQILSRLHSALNGAGKMTPLGEITNGADSHSIQSIVLGRGNPARTLISAGIHGDEPAGVETICALLERNILSEYLQDWEVHLIPCINPFGYENGTRENQDGEDLNRHFKSVNPPKEVTLVKSLLDSRFDLTLELHEDIDSSGYYFYQTGEAEIVKKLPPSILQAVQKAMPINMDSEIDESPASGGVITRISDLDAMGWWPMALYARFQGTRHCMTLESATAFPMEHRVDAHINAIQAALTHFPV